MADCKAIGEHTQHLRVAYIGGGSRGWAWNFMGDLAAEPDMGGTVLLYDIDRPAADANEIIGNKIEALPEAVGRWEYKAAATLEEALTGADFVVISILPGTFDEMEVDVHLPERLDVWQSVGDTAGPGGIVRALRTLPMFVPIAEGIRKCCPDAWVINYTNPMSLCVQVLYHIFPEIKAFGCCHEVFGTQELLAAAVSDILGVEKPTRKDIHVNVTGINHFTWFTKASYRDIDLFPLYKTFSDKYYDSGFQLGSDNWMNSHFACGHRVKFDLFRRYGAITAAGDRHLAEFMPGDEYLKDPDTAHRWMFTLTPVSWRKEDLKNRLAKSRGLVSGEIPAAVKPSGEEGVLLMKAILGLGRMVSNVNLPNRGQIPNLPLGSVVETNAVFARDSVQPVLAGPLPEDLRRLIAPHTENHLRTLQAALTWDRALLVDALMADPNLAAKHPDRAAVEKLAEDMLEGTRAYLPAEWFV